MKEVFEGMALVFRRFGVLVAFALVCVYAAVMLRGPQGVQALVDKRTEIRDLQQQNATLKTQNARMNDRIARLRDSPAEQEIEIRKRLKKVHPGETEFILPEPPKAVAPAPAAEAAPAPSAAQ